MVREPVRALIERAVRQPSISGNERLSVAEIVDDRLEQVSKIEGVGRYVTFATENPPTPSPVVSPGLVSLANV